LDGGIDNLPIRGRSCAPAREHPPSALNPRVPSQNTPGAVGMAMRRTTAVQPATSTDLAQQPAASTVHTPPPPLSPQPFQPSQPWSGSPQRLSHLQPIGETQEDEVSHPHNQSSQQLQAIPNEVVYTRSAGANFSLPRTPPTNHYSVTAPNNDPVILQTPSSETNSRSSSPDRYYEASGLQDSVEVGGDSGGWASGLEDCEQQVQLQETEQLHVQHHQNIEQQEQEQMQQHESVEQQPEEDDTQLSVAARYDGDWSDGRDKQDALSKPSSLFGCKSSVYCNVLYNAAHFSSVDL